jgi:hypothetical protein
MPAAPASTVPGVVGYLYDTIKARSDLAAAQAAETLLVVYGPPGQFQPDQIICVLNDVERPLTPLQVVGNGLAGYLTEEYVVPIVVDVFSGDDDPRTVYETCCTLTDVVIDVIRQDLSLGGRVSTGRPERVTYESDWSTGESTDEQGESVTLYLGRWARAVVQVRCIARI